MINAHSTPSFQQEKIKAIIMAAVSMAGILVLASVVVLWDIQGFRRKVGEIFQVDLNSASVTPDDSGYAVEKAQNMENRLIRGGDTGVLSKLPGNRNESPTLLWKPAGEIPVDPRKAPEKGPEGLTFRRQEHVQQERVSRREVTESSLPVLALKKPGLIPVSRRIAFDAAFVRRGGIGAIGTPGDNSQRLETRQLSSSPSPSSLALPPPTATEFTREEAAGVIGRKLVEHRPGGGYPSLDSDIAAEFSVYRQAGDKDAFFRLEIKLRPESKLKTISKDVLFLIDISQSIPPAELEKVKAAVIAHLATLDAGDRWNVAVFSENMFFADEERFFIPARDFNAEKVEELIRKRPYERRTDVFGVLQLLLGKIPASNRPCNVFLVSDGEATQGTSDVKRMVTDFQRVNRDNFAIFTFNAGSDGNRYLLRLLSYRSRGQFLDCPEAENATATLAEFSRSVSRPAISNVVANYTNIITNDVCPAVLPNLYRDNSIVFWGRTSPGKEIAMRVAGMTENGPGEFFFRAVVPEGDETRPGIAREWALGKAHLLMADLSEDPENRELRAGIVALAEKYGLQEIIDLVKERSMLDLIRRKK